MDLLDFNRGNRAEMAREQQLYVSEERIKFHSFRRKVDWSLEAIGIVFFLALVCASLAL